MMKERRTVMVEADVKEALKALPAADRRIALIRAAQNYSNTILEEARKLGVIPAKEQRERSTESVA